MKVIQRDDLEYEFTLFASLTNDNTLIVEKSRCKTLNGAIIKRPGKEIADTLRAWLNDGAAEGACPPAAAHGGSDTTAPEQAADRSDEVASHRSDERRREPLRATSMQRAAVRREPRRAENSESATIVREIRRCLESAQSQADIEAAVAQCRDALNTKLDRASRRVVRRQIRVAQHRVDGRAA